MGPNSQVYLKRLWLVVFFFFLVEKSCGWLCMYSKFVLYISGDLLNVVWLYSKFVLYITGDLLNLGQDSCILLSSHEFKSLHLRIDVILLEFVRIISSFDMTICLIGHLDS